MTNNDIEDLAREEVKSKIRDSIESKLQLSEGIIVRKKLPTFYDYDKLLRLGIFSRIIEIDNREHIELIFKKSEIIREVQL